MPTILLVDDEATLLGLLHKTLAHEDRLILSANSIHDALIAADSHEIDVAVLDKNLAQGSGIELVKTLREIHPNMEAIIITAYASTESAIEALRVEAFDFIAKPFDIDDVDAKVQAAIERSAVKRKQRDRVRHLYKMEAIGTLAASVGHEINNPLTYIIGNLEYLAKQHEILEGIIPSDTYKEIRAVIEETRDGADRVRQIARELRLFSRVYRDDHVESVEPNAVLRSAARLVENEIRHRATFSFRLGNVPNVLANPLRLSQVFVNLLMNAVQAIPDGNASRHQIECVTSTDDLGRAVIDVRDSGAGIASEHIDRVFERFFTTKEVGDGTGLGLTISRRFVSEMGGEISIDSRVGRGTTVHIVLPPTPIHHTRVKETLNPEDSAVASDSARLLLIDDDACVAKSLQRCLPEHDVRIVTSGREALNLLQHDSGFDVILCDIMMPDVTGIDLHAELKTRSPRVADQIVFMTGGVFTRRARQFVDSVTNRVMEKPISTRELRGLLSARARQRRDGVDG